MANLFKKAMGLFVEFDEDPQRHVSPAANAPMDPRPPARAVLNDEELDKFEKHFEKLFDQQNLPGPDYYEFMKMMETLEVHIKDENARISATYAALAIQGLTKEKLVETANVYRQLIDQDQAQFEKSAQDKLDRDIGQKVMEVKQQEETIARHAEAIQKLTKEITEAQQAMAKLKGTIAVEEEKLSKNKQGYRVACEAMTRKIVDDITKIQTNL
ncbi:DUF4047 domain-containing protein [Chryseolinea lacunae]|uniref:DUF4047 domain-containing protein n=1 Tax=Chryseolinea lacunae TaxID=2801331 RepID=A0ABS1KS06_9BACT|nr:DUF4047 domain-containing protein [Chryseolinea lacunae]MBL0741973.1 DUF4047 domain-containing protein [Chryseolinea lacunae]